MKKYELSGVFTSRVFKDLALGFVSPTVTALANGRILRDYFDAAFLELSELRNRNEYFYKNVLVNNLLPKTVVSEFNMLSGSRRADLVMFDDTSYLYEIKSERDSLIKLDSQINIYSRVFDRIHVVCAQSLVDKVIQMVDPHVGVMTVDSDMRLMTRKESTPNKDNVVSGAIYNVMRQGEVTKVLKSKFHNLVDAPTDVRYDYLRKHWYELPQKETHEGFVHILRENRQPRKPVSDFITALPMSLKELGTSIRLNAAQRERVLKTLDGAPPEVSDEYIR